ncbi:MAG: DUF3798 domain-containing protein, partial [Clostridiales bacterium]|nr:DUF3798 domain-containing protein [Clostridiales bacterium]
MKKLLCMLLALMISMIALGGIASAEEGNWKIAILTGTTTQGEEEFRAAERLAAAYPDNVITDTYPDQFMAEQETTIS